MAKLTYSFKEVQAAIVGPGGVINLGNGSGPAQEGISFSSKGDINTMTVGADGLGMHSLSMDRSGSATVRFLKTSPTNALLMLMYNLQISSGSSHGQNTITLTDTNRGDNVTCEQVAFRKAPDLTFATEAGTVEWEFDVVKMTRVLGGL